MKIRGWTIDGYGIFRDVRSPAIPDGLTVLHGPNETGKSTLLAFLRGVLCGFPTLRHRGPHYPPVGGGRHGGRLDIEVDGTRWTIDRRAGKTPRTVFLDAGGKVFDPARSAELPLLVDPLLYRTVFAFDLDELESFERLSAAEVQERLFSASLAGAGRSAVRSMSELDRRIEALFRPRATCRIREHVARLSDLKNRLRTARRAALEYPETRRREVDTAAAAQAATVALTKTRAEVRTLELLLELWPRARALEAADAELAGLEPVESFPQDAELRATRLLQDMEAAAAALSEAESEMRALEKRRATLVFDARRAGLLPKLENFAGQWSLRRDRVTRLAAAEHETKEITSRAQTALAELGRPEEEIRRMSELSVRSREEVRRFEADLATSRLEVRGLEQRTAAARSNVESSLARVQRLGERIAGPMPLTRDDIEARFAAQRRLRSAMECWHLLLLRCEDLERRLEELDDVMEKVDGEKRGSGKLATFLLVGMTSFGGSFFFEGVVPRLILITLGAAIVTALTSAALHERRRRFNEEDRRNTENRRRRRHAEKLENDLVASRRELEGIEAGSRPDLRRLSVHEWPTTQVLDSFDESLRRASMERSARDRAEAEVVEARAALEVDRTRVRELEEQLQTAAGRQREVEGRFARFKNERGIPADLSPLGATEFLERASRTRELLLRVDESRRRRDEAERDIAAFDRELKNLLSAAGCEFSLERTGERNGQLLMELIETVRRDVDQAKEHGHLSAEIMRRVPRVELLRKRRQAADAAWSMLLSAAGASDETSFRRRLEVWKRRKEVEETRRRHNDFMDERLGRGAEAAELRERLYEGHMESWRAAAEQTRVRMAREEQQQIEEIRRHRDAEVRRQECELSADMATLELERQSASHELAVDLRQVRVLRAARRLIADSLDAWVNSRQPVVLEESAGFLREITAGRWTRILQDAKDHSLRILDATGAVYSPAELSRGTVEQVYFSLRLGLVAEFQRRGLNLPVILDDVFVNFDETRTRGAARALAKLAQTHQILVFTCHTWVRDLFLAETGTHFLPLQEGLVGKAET